MRLSVYLLAFSALLFTQLNAQKPDWEGGYPEGCTSVTAGKPATADGTSLAARRREWRVFDLATPSLGLDPYAEYYPFSVKPDKKLTLADLVTIFSDYYEGTPFDMTKDLLVPDDSGKMVISQPSAGELGDELWTKYDELF